MLHPVTAPAAPAVAVLVYLPLAAVAVLDYLPLAAVAVLDYLPLAAVAVLDYLPLAAVAVLDYLPLAAVAALLGDPAPAALLGEAAEDPFLPFRLPAAALALRRLYSRHARRILHCCSCHSTRLSAQREQQYPAS